MRLRDVVRASAQSLRGNPVRSLLTVLGLSIGVGACIAIGSLGTAAVNEVNKEMDRFGVDRIWINESPGNQTRLSAQDAELLRAVGSAVAPMCYDAVRASEGSAQSLCALIATSGDYTDIENLTLASGRFLMALDEEKLLRTAVIEDILEEKLFGAGQGLGQRIALDEHSYTVVGVIRTQYSEYFGSDAGKPKAYVPLKTYQQLTGSQAVDEIVVRAQDLTVGAAAAQAKAALASAHAAGDAFVVTSMAEQIASAERIVRIVTTVLVVIGVICMLTGGVGVMNVMLTSVRERRREIGVRKALGARDAEVFAQFVCESALYGALGAGLGMLTGLGLTSAGERIIGIEAQPVLWVMVCAVAFSCMVGAASGVYPAMRAAGVSPVTAMRQT